MIIAVAQSFMKYGLTGFGSAIDVRSVIQEELHNCFVVLPYSQVDSTATISHPGVDVFSTFQCLLNAGDVRLQCSQVNVLSINIFLATTGVQYAYQKKYHNTSHCVSGGTKRWRDKTKQRTKGSEKFRAHSSVYQWCN